MPRASWEALFRAQGMKNPLPRMRMLDGFKEGWITFPDRSHPVRKGRTTLVDVIAEGINGQGWVKTVPPSTYLRTWKDYADDGTAAALGKRTKAASAL